MSHIRKIITDIENLNVDQLCEAIEYNGYGECLDKVRGKSVDGKKFLQLTEVEVSLWRLPIVQKHRFWSFVELVRQNPSNFVFVPKKPKIVTPQSNHFKPNNFQTNKPLVHPQLLQKPALPSNESKNFKRPETTPENTKSSTLTKNHSQAVKGKLEHLFDSNRNNSFLHGSMPLPQKLPINKYDKKISNDDDIDYDGYLPPINVEKKVLKTSPQTVFNIPKEPYENHNIAPELPPIRQKVNLPAKRPLPPIPSEQPNIAKPLAKPPEILPSKSSFLFRNPMPAFSNERKQFEKPETPVIEDYISVLGEDEPGDHDEHLAEYSAISEEEEAKQFRSENFGSQLQLFNINKNKQNIVEEAELLYEAVDEVIQKFGSRPLPPPPIPFNPLSNKKKVEEVEKDDEVEYLSDSDEESVLGELKKMSKIGRPVNTMAKSQPRSPLNLPKPPVMLPKPPVNRFEELNLAGNDNYINRKPPDIPKNNFETLIPKPPARQFEEKSLTRSNPSISRDPPELPIEEISRKLSKTHSEEMNPQRSDTFKNIKPQENPKDNVKIQKYYRATDRKGARKILQNLEEGTFLVRPSRESEYIATLSIMHTQKMFNVGIIQDQTTGLIKLDNENVEQPNFKKVSDLIDYYCIHPLYLSKTLIVLKNTLPLDRR